MCKIVLSNKFEKNFVQYAKDKKILREIQKISDYLVKKEKLPVKYMNHKLNGFFEGCYDCHVRPDVVLIYARYKKDKNIYFIDIGSHAKLFK
ncbi:MAG: type II toxin-antitoxin system YafQ family toxin [Candidatus Pacebacteria bacterium]|nr:type II toxin-antitoxin system YafQ family toxin [Candidatus Paceibacterota bacterium]